MRRHSPPRSLSLIATLVIACAWLAPPADADPDRGARATAANPVPALPDLPQSRVEGEEVLRDAAAAAVATALVEQFPGERVELQLHSVEAGIASIRDREVHGSGRMRFAGDDDWLPFGYRALYDTEHGVAIAPRLTLGDAGARAAGAGAPLDPEVAASLDAEARRRLDGEFAGQRVALRIESATAQPLSARYLRVDAAAVADFGAEGSTPARIAALYDRRDGRWLQLGYELGPSAPASAPALDPGEVATR